MNSYDNNDSNNVNNNDSMSIDAHELKQCIKSLNNQLFNKNDNNDNSNNNYNNNDISIETMNNLLTEIDYEMKNDNQQTQLLSQLYPTKIVHFIETPVKKQSDYCCVFFQIVCF